MAQTSLSQTSLSHGINKPLSWHKQASLKQASLMAQTSLSQTSLSHGTNKPLSNKPLSWHKQASHGKNKPLSWHKQASLKQASLMAQTSLSHGTNKPLSWHKQASNGTNKPLMAQTSLHSVVKLACTCTYSICVKKTFCTVANKRQKTTVA